MDKEGLGEAVGFLKRAIYFSRLLKAVSVAEKAILISAAALTVGEALLILKKTEKLSERKFK